MKIEITSPNKTDKIRNLPYGTIVRALGFDDVLIMYGSNASGRAGVSLGRPSNNWLHDIGDIECEVVGTLKVVNE